MKLQRVRILVTRARHQAEELAAPLRQLGADVVIVPMIGLVPPADPRPLQQAAAHSAEYDWIIFTSANAVHSFDAERPIKSTLAAAIGVATADAARRSGWQVALVPEEHTAEALVDLFKQEALMGKRLLIPSAAVTRDVLAPALRSLGAYVDVVEAYRNAVPREATAQARHVFEVEPPNWVTFASSSAAQNLIDAVGVDALGTVKIASIGPATSATIRERGLKVTAEATDHTVTGLVDCLVHHANR